MSDDIKCFENEPACEAGGPVKGTLSLDVYFVTIAESPKEREENEFSIHGPSSTFTFRASSPEERDGWYHTLLKFPDSV